MDADKLRQLILQTESAKLDFKIELCKLNEPKPAAPTDIQKWADDKDRQWAELIKDILGLTNGNVGTATETAYLVIGAADQRKADDSRALRDTGDIDTVLNRRTILDKVNSFCQPKIPDIKCGIISIDGVKLFVISIPPSPYLHKLSKQLKTPKKEYSPHTVLIRRGDGEETYEASEDEQKAIQQEKQGRQVTDHNGSVKHQGPGGGQKLPLEIYDRKIEIYRTARSFLGLIISEGAVTLQPLLKFAHDIDEALFMFDYEVADHLRALYVNATKLYYTTTRLADSHLPVGEERSRVAEEKSKLLAWFTEQVEVTRNLFRKYISL